MDIWAQQRTLRFEAFTRGVGLHTGCNVSVRLKPAKAGTGILFRRVDLPGRPMIQGRHDRVVDTSLATVIGEGDVRISTVEHLLAALMGEGIDNVVIDVDGPEIPVLDGSAAPFCRLVREAGIRDLGIPRRVYRLTSEIMVSQGDAFIRVRPSERMRIRYVIDFPHPLVGHQSYSWEARSEEFEAEIAGARTFGFLRDVKKLQNMGYALGGSLNNALVFDDTGLINGDGFRYRDECVRHKILDFIGDMALLPHGIVGEFEAYKAGHSLHNRLLHAIMNHRAARTRLVPVTLPMPIVLPSPFRSYAKSSSPEI